MHRDRSTSIDVCGVSCISIACGAQSTVLASMMIGVVGVTGKKPEGRKRLGFIKIDVADVVKNRRITDTWTLMDSQQGEIQLKLEWMPLQLAEVM